MSCKQSFSKACFNLFSLATKSICVHIKRQYCGLQYTMGSPSISVTFLSNGSILAPNKSLIINTAYECYLFNAPEGISRVLQESGPRLSKISHIFVTGNQWDLYAGLIGTCLNIRGSARQSSVRLHGPPIISEVGTLMAKFSDSIGMKLVYNLEDDISDSVFEIKSLRLKSDSDQSESYCYLLKPFPLSAKLDILKAVSMDFPVAMLKDGVTAKRLKNGERVELPDGRVFDGKELLIEPVLSKSILLLDCATPALARELASSQRLRHWITGEGGVDLAVHMADYSLLRSDEYRSVLNLFQSSEAKHVAMDGRNCTPALYGAHQCQLMLNSLHEGIFPLLYGHRFMIREDEKSPLAPARLSPRRDTFAEQSFPVTSCEVFQEYHLRPPFGFDPDGTAAVCSTRSRNLAFTETAMRDKTFEDSELHISREEFASRMAEFAAERARFEPGPGSGVKASSQIRSYPWVQFLGTVSSNPFKYRNVSSILLHVSDKTKVLLDCGEGTLFQLLNFYGETDCQAVLRSIRAVCISHMHLDHQSGIFCLLKARRKAFTDAGLAPVPCAFVGPRGFMRWLEFFTLHDSCGLGTVISAGNLDLYWSETLSGVSSLFSTVEVHTELLEKFDDFVRNSLGLEEIAVVPVDHSTKVAFGFAISGKRVDDVDGKWKIVYSGDTVPCDSLVQAGMDCDLLIHEATFHSDFFAEASAKKHSTVGQALSQAAAMRARHAVLTHFSTRYTCAVPDYDCSGSGYDAFGYAYDHMCVSLDDLAFLPRITPMLPYLFPKHFAQLDKRPWLTKSQPTAADFQAADAPGSDQHFGVNRGSATKRRRID